MQHCLAVPSSRLKADSVGDGLLVNGSWPEGTVMGMLVRGEVDLALSSLMLTADRAAAIDTTPSCWVRGMRPFVAQTCIPCQCLDGPQSNGAFALIVQADTVGSDPRSSFLLPFTPLTWWVMVGLDAPEGPALSALNTSTLAADWRGCVSCKLCAV